MATAQVDPNSDAEFNSVCCRQQTTCSAYSCPGGFKNPAALATLGCSTDNRYFVCDCRFFFDHFDFGFLLRWSASSMFVAVLFNKQLDVALKSYRHITSTCKLLPGPSQDNLTCSVACCQSTCYPNSTYNFSSYDCPASYDHRPEAGAAVVCANGTDCLAKCCAQRMRLLLWCLLFPLDLSSWIAPIRLPVPMLHSPLTPSRMLPLQDAPYPPPPRPMARSARAHRSIRRCQSCPAPRVKLHASPTMPSPLATYRTYATMA
jgi:hypothetical protein